MGAVDFVLIGVGLFLSCCLIVGIVSVWSSVGPNCPAPVPAEYLGFCEAFDGQ